jgi:hypothetical protein
MSSFTTPLLQSPIHFGLVIRLRTTILGAHYFGLLGPLNCINGPIDHRLKDLGVFGLYGPFIRVI